MAEVFGWCAECGRFVGRACCWGPDQRCAGCGEARPVADLNGDGGGFAALAGARAAVRQLDGVAAEFSVIEEALAATGGADVVAAVGAWEDVWLAAGGLRARLDGRREAAISLIGAVTPGEAERALELEEELGAVTVSHAARWQSMTEGIVEAGRRLATRLGPQEPRPLPAPAPVAREPASIPVPAVAVAIPLPIRPPDRVTVPVAAASLARAPRPPAPAPRPITPTITPLIAEPTIAVTTTPSRPAPRPPSRPHAARRPPATSTATPAAVAEPTRPEPTRPMPAAPEPSTAGHGTRRRVGVVAALVVIAGVALAGVIGPLGPDSGIGSDRDRDADLPANVDGAAASASQSASAPSPAAPLATGSQTSSPLLVTFDLHPVGPVDPQELRTSRIIGAPEVAPFPTPFDRSLRLSDAAAGVCLELSSPSQGAASSMTLDLYRREAGSGGSLAFGLASTATTPAIGLTLDLVMLEDLDRDAWYRLTVTGEGAAGRLEVTPLDDDRVVLEATLGLDATIAPTATDEACLRSSLPTSGASLFVDNLRVDR